MKLFKSLPKRCSRQWHQEVPGIQYAILHGSLLNRSRRWISILDFSPGSGKTSTYLLEILKMMQIKGEEKKFFVATSAEHLANQLKEHLLPQVTGKSNVFIAHKIEAIDEFNQFDFVFWDEADEFIERNFFNFDKRSPKKTWYALQAAQL